MGRALISTVLLLGLTACATVSDLPPDYAVGANGEGLVIVSLTLSGKTLDRISSFEFRVREAAPKDGDQVRTKPYFDSAKQFERWVVEGDNERRATDWGIIVKGPNSSEPLNIADAGKATGRLAALRLPAGHYELYTWKLREPNPYGGTEYSPSHPVSYRFSVKPGQVIYIGQLNLHLSERNTQTITVDDNRGRDLAVLMEKIPSIRAGQISFSVGR